MSEEVTVSGLFDTAFAGYTNTATTADTPTLEELLEAMRKFRETERRYEGTSREVAYIAMSDLTHDARRVSPKQLAEWSRGENFPSFLNDFDGWWLAVSVQHRLVTTKYYEVDLSALRPAWRWVR